MQFVDPLLYFFMVTMNVHVTVFFQMRMFNEHQFWKERYCPAHEADGTPKCFSCERLEVSLSFKQQNTAKGNDMILRINRHIKATGLSSYDLD